MTLAILQTGAPPHPLRDRFGDYPQMFTRLLAGPLAPLYPTFDVTRDDWPAAPEAFDAYIVTGSAAGVYDPLPWMEPLKAFLRQARGKAALVGVCFGHQIMTEAFGGRVVKSQKGWAIGMHRYRVAVRERWMDDAAEIAVPASHQDQVVEPPPNSEVAFTSAFTPYAGLAYRDQPAISLQCHPEFEPAYAAALIEARRGSRYTDVQADTAIASLNGPDDRARVGGWIRAFLGDRLA